MAAATRFVSLLFFFCSFSILYARGTPVTTKGVRWIREGRRVLVHLDTPELPLWNTEEQIGEDKPSAFVFKISIAPDNRTLLLQDQPIYPLPDPNVPPRLSAPQTAETWSQFQNDTNLNLPEGPHFGLDYSLHPYRGLTHNGEYCPQCHQEVRFRLLGAGISGYNTLFQSRDQKFIIVTLKEDLKAEISDRTEPGIRIMSVVLQERGYTKYTSNDDISPGDLGKCTFWSWRCAERKSLPYYEHIFRQHFDEYGRIGSLRHMLVQRWSTLRERLGPFQLWLLTAAVACMALSPLCYALYQAAKRAGKHIQESRRRSRAAAVAALDEDEVEGLLYGVPEWTNSGQRHKYVDADNGLGG